MWREEGRDENDDVAMSERPTPISRRLCASFRGPQSTFNSSFTSTFNVLVLGIPVRVEQRRVNPLRRLRVRLRRGTKSV